jgi:hypothetical protein
MKSFVATKTAVLLLVALSVAACDTMQAQSSGDANEAAVNFVVKQNVGGNLFGLAKAAARRTQTFSMLAAKLGKDRASTLVDEEIAALVPAYQPAWYRKMADVYAGYFSEDELRSLAKDGTASQYAAKWDSQRERIGADVRANSQYILSQLISRALENAVIKVGGLGSTEARGDSQAAGRS